MPLLKPAVLGTELWYLPFFYYLNTFSLPEIVLLWGFFLLLCFWGFFCGKREKSVLKFHNVKQMSVYTVLQKQEVSFTDETTWWS